MKSPPRVLHLATHGFYLANETREPMMQSGVALAGANRELAGKGADGILFALEAQGLNLEGSELVVLSACDTAQGVSTIRKVSMAWCGRCAPPVPATCW